MSFTYSFQNILELRKRQKEQKSQEYEQSVQQFERMASALYDLLKQKEELESLYEKQMSTGIYVHQLQQSEKAVFQLQQRIADIQKQTDKARDNMHKKEEEMQEASIEWKKYSRMKEWEKEEFHLEEKRQEEKMMDEISTRKFAFR
ncbi:flagellar export protein FliJ [Salibacterium qingdaonense]|uniref:Flagellar FliJ protein n=1 Tax=Salibacterium qingdaonense TaxID=266892 RepID=A0A1I4PPT0_9BACI|nr:flagellar export protein FliJ [Salibacterium qingdaonense]SFM29842.1 flagellar FliJ protein [Salibacterium qingdaonense]